MDALRTPDDRFADLPGYDFDPNYAEIDGLRVHYVDEGPPDAEEVVLMMHGEPSWSYLYREMIRVVADAGHRVIAPDLVGFGRSDKPAAPEDYTYARHVAWTRELLFDVLDLSGVTLFCQDWGGLIGLRLVAEHSERFARVIAANTGLPTGDQPMPEAFIKWQTFSREAEEFDVGKVIQGGTVRTLSDAEVAAYDAPFPDDSYKAGARIFPSLVPTSSDDPANAANRAAWATLMTLELPFVTAFSDQDPITRGGERFFHDMVPGAKGQPHRTIEGGGHFLQEDRGGELAGLIVDLLDG